MQFSTSHLPGSTLISLHSQPCCCNCPYSPSLGDFTPSFHASNVLGNNQLSQADNHVLWHGKGALQSSAAEGDGFSAWVLTGNSKVWLECGEESDPVLMTFKKLQEKFPWSWVMKRVIRSCAALAPAQCPGIQLCKADLQWP